MGEDRLQVEDLFLTPLVGAMPPHAERARSLAYLLVDLELSALILTLGDDFRCLRGLWAF